MIYLAILFEIVVSAFSTSYNDWGVYGFLAELRTLFWIIVAFNLSKKVNLILRSVILFFGVCQVWTCIIFLFHVYGVEFSYSVYIEIVALSLCCLWIVFRPYGAPKTAVRIDDIDSRFVYAIFKKTSSSANFLNILKGFFGYPVGTVFIFCGGNLYGYVTRKPSYCKIKYRNFVNRNDKYAIKLPISKDSAEKTLNGLIGVKFRPLKANCSNTPAIIWRLSGLRSSILHCSPGMLARGLSRGLKNAQQNGA